MKRVTIEARVKKSDLLKKIEIAEDSVKKLCEVMQEFKFFENGITQRMNAETEEKEGHYWRIYHFSY